MKPSCPISSTRIESPASSPRSESSLSLASSKTSWSDGSLAASKTDAPAASLDDEPEDILVLVHPPEGTRVVETPEGPVLKPVTYAARILEKIRTISQAIGGLVSFCTDFITECLRVARRFVTDRILRLDPIREEMRPLRNNLAVHGYPIKPLENALRKANSALGPLANRVDHAWVQKVVEGRLISSFALESNLASPHLATRERGVHDFARALRHIMVLATSPTVCDASRAWTGWSSSKGSLASWADGFAVLCLPQGIRAEFLFAHVPGNFSLEEGVMFGKALMGGPNGGANAQNAQRLLAFLSPAKDAVHLRLEALLKLSDVERWRFLGASDALSIEADHLISAAVDKQTRDREERLFARALTEVDDLGPGVENEAAAHLDRFLEFARDRRVAWLQRLVRLPPEVRAHLIFNKPQEARSLLALETLVAEHRYAERFGGCFEDFAE